MYSCWDCPPHNNYLEFSKPGKGTTNLDKISDLWWYLWNTPGVIRSKYQNIKNSEVPCDWSYTALWSHLQNICNPNVDRKILSMMGISRKFKKSLQICLQVFHRIHLLLYRKNRTNSARNIQNSKFPFPIFEITRLIAPSKMYEILKKPPKKP